MAFSGRWGPWLHAVLVALAAVALLLAERWTGPVWAATALLAVSRVLGALVAAIPKRALRRRGTVRDDLTAVRREAATIATAVHTLNNKLAIVIAEVDLVIARIDAGER